MKTKITFLMLIVSCLFFSNCYDLTDAGIALSLLNQNNDKTSAIQNTINTISKDLISRGKAQIVIKDGKNFIIPIKPFTYTDMQKIFEVEMENKLGNKWDRLLNDYIINNDELFIDGSQLPQEVSPIDSSAQYTTASVLDTGVVERYFDNASSWSTNRTYCDKSWGAIPYGGSWWPIGISVLYDNFTILSSVEIVQITVYDDDSDAYKWKYLDGVQMPDPLTQVTVYNTTGFQLKTKKYTKLLGQTNLWISGWDILVYVNGNPNPEQWNESF